MHRGGSVPHAQDVTLPRFHIHIDRPQIPSLRVRVNNALENRLATFRIAELVLKLRKLRDGLQI